MSQFPHYRLHGDDSGIRVEAVQLTEENAHQVEAWTNGLLIEEHNALNHEITQPGINVPTALGNKRASLGSWILLTDAGQFFVNEEETFLRDFELVEE